MTFLDHGLVLRALRHNHHFGLAGSGLDILCISWFQAILLFDLRVDLHELGPAQLEERHKRQEEAQKTETQKMR